MKLTKSQLKEIIREEIKTLNEGNPMINKKVRDYLTKELRDLSNGGPDLQFAIMHILIGALTDANFHSEVQKLKPIFKKAEYNGDLESEKKAIKRYQSVIGRQVSKMCDWDADIIMGAVGFYTSMTVGRPVGQRVEDLVETLTETTYDSRAKSFLDAVRVVDSSIKDLKNITVDATPQGNWTVYHKGRVLTTVNRKMLDDKTISKYGLEESVQPLMEWSAAEVLKQLGGNKFIAMTGAKNFVKDDKTRTIYFKIGRAKNGINYVRITLKGSDTYTMEFISLRGGNLKIVKEVNGVYNDQLQSIFTQYTGLDTSL